MKGRGALRKEKELPRDLPSKDLCDPVLYESREFHDTTGPKRFQQNRLIVNQAPILFRLPERLPKDPEAHWEEDAGKEG